MHLLKGTELWLMFVVELNGYDLDDKKIVSDVKHTIAITIGDSHEKDILDSLKRLLHGFCGYSINCLVVFPYKAL